MFLKQRNTGHLVEVLDQGSLFDPHNDCFRGRLNIGEDVPDAEEFAKSDVCFLSGEALPQCWVDVHYRDIELHR